MLEKNANIIGNHIIFIYRLGNPYPSNRTDVLLFRVVPSHSSPFVKPEATFTVVTNTSSEDLGSDLDRTHQLQVN